MTYTLLTPAILKLSRVAYLCLFHGIGDASEMCFLFDMPVRIRSESLAEMQNFCLNLCGKKGLKSALKQIISR